MRAEDVHNIQFTSGTTGLPKGAMLTHRNVLLNAFYTGERLRYSSADRVCVPVPFYHCFGCVLGSLVCSRLRRGDRGTRPVVRRGRHARGHRRRALHRGLRCSDDVHLRSSNIPTSPGSTSQAFAPGIMSGAPARCR